MPQDWYSIPGPLGSGKPADLRRSSARPAGGPPLMAVQPVRVRCGSSEQAVTDKAVQVSDVGEESIGSRFPAIMSEDVTTAAPRRQADRPRGIRRVQRPGVCRPAWQVLPLLPPGLGSGALAVELHAARRTLPVSQARGLMRSYCSRGRGGAIVFAVEWDGSSHRLQIGRKVLFHVTTRIG